MLHFGVIVNLQLIIYVGILDSDGIDHIVAVDSELLKSKTGTHRLGKLACKLVESLLNALAALSHSIIFGLLGSITLGGIARAGSKCESPATYKCGSK